MTAEMLLLRCLGFQTAVPDVYEGFSRTAQDLKISDRVILQVGVALLNDCIHQTEV